MPPQLLPTPLAANGALVTEPGGILAILLGTLGLIFWSSTRPTFGRIYKVIPLLVFCYFIPTTLTTLGVIPAESPLYSWIKTFVLPASLLLLILALDLPAIMRLGPKAIIMMLAGTAGVVIGAPVALLLGKLLLRGSFALPDDAWQGMTALSGSWIGGGANFVALGQIAGASDEMIATMVIPDVAVASLWMGVLLYLAGRQHEVDRWTGADATAIRELERRLTEFQERVNRVPTLADLIVIVAIAFVGSWLAHWAGGEMAALSDRHKLRVGGTPLTDILSGTTWKFILVTTLGLLLSFTALRNLEGAGASKIGSVMLYLLVACIGASADFALIFKAPGLFITGLIWMAVHVTVLLTVAWLIKAPIFFVAVGSQANIGGAASAPIVAAAYHPSLAPVGVLLAVLGYVLGTYAGIICMHMLKAVAGA